jgi:hypothetical protein
MIKRRVSFFLYFIFPIMSFSEESSMETFAEPNVEEIVDSKSGENLEGYSDWEEDHEANIISITIPCQEFTEPEVVYPIEESDFAEVYRKIP